MVKLKNIINPQHVKVCYLDMDGVLCDFDSQFKKYLSSDALFNSVVRHRKAISQKKLADRGMTKEDFVKKAFEIREKVLASNPKDTFEMFKKLTRDQLGVPLSWRYIMKSRETFWNSMDWMPEGKQLVKFVLNSGIDAEILTAGAGDYAKNGKQQWLQKNGLGNLPFNIVDKGSDKGIFGEKGSLLIDDKQENITAFINEGGLGIFHRDTKSTINQLEKILKNG